MHEHRIVADSVELPSLSIEDIDVRIRKHAIRTLGEAASFYGAATGYSIAPVGMSQDARKALISRVEAPMLNLRKELGFDSDE